MWGLMAEIIEEKVLRNKNYVFRTGLMPENYLPETGTLC